MQGKYRRIRRIVFALFVAAALFAAATPYAAEASTVYTVKRGDTLWKISQRFGTTVYELKRANNHWQDTIYPGQRLVITWPSTATSRGAGTYMINASKKDIDLMAKMVYGEARGEPFEGQVAVAAVVLNRVRDNRFPNTIAGVIYEPGAFTAVQDGQFYLTPNTTAYNAADNALKGWDPSEGALFYFNPATATSKWIWSRQIIKKIGKHYFAK